MKRKYKLLFFMVIILLSSCDYLDTIPKGKVIPRTTEDFYHMVINPSTSVTGYPLANMGSDDVFFSEQSANTDYQKAYFWMENFHTVNDADYAWNTSYEHIYLMNVIIDNILDSEGGSKEEKEAVLAEAKCWRAYYYWYLQSLYAPAYNAETSETDLSVPLVLKPDLEVLHARATVKQVTEAILDDLADAEKMLPSVSTNNFRPNKGAVHALKARIYLYLGAYDKASEHAELALKENSFLYDMRTWEFYDDEEPSMGIDGRADSYDESPEKIWYQEADFAMIITVFCISEELQNLYKDGDLRFKFGFSNLDWNGDLWSDERFRYLQELDYSFTVPEMMLIQAEALARKNDAGALDILNKLRVLRFAEEDFKPLTKEDGKDLLTLVLEERRLELCYSGLRWLDMKRLSKEGLYTKTLVRTFNGEEYKLEPNSKLYTFPIPPQVLSLNPKIVPNDRK